MHHCPLTGEAQRDYILTESQEEEEEEEDAVLLNA
jgi:hypothetical protein